MSILSEIIKYWAENIHLQIQRCRNYIPHTISCEVTRGWMCPAKQSHKPGKREPQEQQLPPTPAARGREPSPCWWWGGWRWAADWGSETEGSSDQTTRLHGQVSLWFKTKLYTYIHKIKVKRGRKKVSSDCWVGEEGEAVESRTELTATRALYQEDGQAVRGEVYTE